MEKAYDPKKTEAKWYTFWEEGKFFEADPHSSKPPYCIIIPPPNVTGILHMGHALGTTLQDILTRWKRMSGYEALWIPGTDHAGIATQTVVERHLMATKGKRRKDYSRDEFLEFVWQWKEKSEKVILQQIKQMGSSCDWSRLCFTMDERRSKAIRTMFKKLFDAGYIYRGNYLVNWDPITQTALADDEVEYEERASHLWYFKYHLVDNPGYVVIATTRPETMLGDTAIAVSPKDERYAELIGQKLRLPIIDRQIPIIADHHVDPEFGTGALKVTPAHDPNDYRMGIEHHLEMINILTPDGYINENGGPFRGLSREEARQAVVKQMDALGLLEKVEDYTLRVGVSYRSKAVIEPYLSKQWFIKMSPFVDKLKSAVTDQKVKIIPKVWENTYFHWVNNLRDWCISRQLWWGHQIPVWYRKDDPEQMVCSEDSEPNFENPEMWEQDPDVLDTWFSSSIWPLSTLGWPEETPELKKFYPTSVLETGHDILFFWVARMILMGEYALDQVPFHETFLHGLIYGKSYWKKTKEGEIFYITGEEKKEYDLGKPLPSGVHSKWEKLSKSKGNVIDPLEMIDEYGTDAVRMALCSIANQTPQIDLDRRRFEEFKNFANKIWNGARFIFMNLEGLSSEALAKGLGKKFEQLDFEDRWILSSLNRINREINAHLENYAFDQAATLAYNFFWNEFCAYYLEIAKSSMDETKQKILVIVLTNMLRLLHPMAPFITEELFQILKERFPNLKPAPSDPYTEATIEALQSPACMVAPYPTVVCEKDIDPKIQEKFTLIEQVIYTIRNIRGEMKIPPQMTIDLYLVGAKREDLMIDKAIKALVKIHRIEHVEKTPELGVCAKAYVQHLQIAIPLPKELEQKERERLKKERERVIQNLDRLKMLLSNPNFLDKAKPELVKKQKNALLQSEEELKSINEKLSQM